MYYPYLLKEYRNRWFLIAQPRKGKSLATLALDRGRNVVLWVHPQHAPYVLTKPLHTSQELLKQDETGRLIRICVVLNFELERELLGFGETIKVVSPRDLQQRISKRIDKMQGLYGKDDGSGAKR